MKTMKRLAGIALALVLALALMAPAMAAGEGSITIDNPQLALDDAGNPTNTYTAYKIFDVTYNTDKTAFSYTISTSSPWWSVVSGYAEVNANEDIPAAPMVSSLVLTQSAADETVYIVTITDDFSAADFARYLSDKVPTGAPGTKLEPNADNTKVSADNLELGYWFVKSGNGALCNLTTTTPSVTIHDKNEIVFDKTDTDDTVEIGQTVGYTIKGKVPDTTGFSTYTYKVSDNMSEGLTFNKDVKVSIGGRVLSENEYEIEYTDSGFELDLYMLNSEGKAAYTFGADIVIEYTAVVNEKAIAKTEKNDAKLVYSNDPANPSSTGERTDEETVYSAQITVDKVDEKGEPLVGAKFVLKNSEGKYYRYITADTDPQYDEGHALPYVKWVDDVENATEVETKLGDILSDVAPDEDGVTAAPSLEMTQRAIANFQGLKDGAYKLVETAAPAGYNLLTEEVDVTVNGAVALQYTPEVVNNTGLELPDTGGIGTTIFTVGGSVLMIGAAILFITKKRSAAK